VKVVIDTNILIAIIPKKSPFRWIFDCLIEGDLILCVSSEILLEYREILERKNGVAVAENVINFIVASPFTHKTEIYYNFHLIKQDEDDNKFVDCAISANAFCLVSDDNHFNVLKTVEFPIVNLLRLNDFEKEYRSILEKK
jgi:uncharacterized protein